MSTFLLRYRNLPEPTLRVLKQVLLVVSAGPCLLLILNALRGTLGVNPVETLTRDTGIWALNFLLLTLAMAPARLLTGWSWPLRLRRMLGLYAFFYASLHVATYLIFDQFFDGAEILKDVVKRPFITAGFLTYVLLAPLAITSTKAMMRRLGTHWKPLHRLIYLAAIAGVLHYLWLVKRDITDPGIYIIVLCALLSARMMKPKKAGGLRQPAAVPSRSGGLAPAQRAARPAKTGIDGPSLQAGGVQWMAQQNGDGNIAAPETPAGLPAQPSSPMPHETPAPRDVTRGT